MGTVAALPEARQPTMAGMRLPCARAPCFVFSHIHSDIYMQSLPPQGTQSKANALPTQLPVGVMGAGGGALQEPPSAHFLARMEF